MIMDTRVFVLQTTNGDGELRNFTNQPGDELWIYATREDAESTMAFYNENLEGTGDDSPAFIVELHCMTFNADKIPNSQSVCIKTGGETSDQ